MHVAHLAASPFVGGPEAQMLGLIGVMPSPYRSTVLSFSEGGRCRTLLKAAEERGAEAVELQSNAPRYRAAVKEVADHLRRLRADVLCCHGYKPDILGLFAARRAGIPVISVSHGWTAATWKVRLNETLDRLSLLGMDRVVCVSEAQAKRVRKAGVSKRRAVVIHNAIDAGKYFDAIDPAGRDELLGLFPNRPRILIGSAGRLSPEKGYAVLVESAALVLRENPDVGFLHFGEGVSRPEVERRIAELGLEGKFILGGFRSDLPSVLPHFDLFAQPSFTEGLPCAVLEAFACGVPVAATAVGGTPEVVADGINGRLVPPGNPEILARAILNMIAQPETLKTMGEQGRALVLGKFTFERQWSQYEQLFDEILRPNLAGRAVMAK